MIITTETKERFVKMLDENQIIIINARILDRKYPHYKIIGANNSGKWDFTPCVAHVTNCGNIPVCGGEIAISGTIDIHSILQDALRNLYDERIESAFFKENKGCGYELYSYCREHTCMFNA